MARPKPDLKPHSAKSADSTVVHPPPLPEPAFSSSRREQSLLDELKHRLALVARREAELARRERELLERAEKIAAGDQHAGAAELDAARRAVEQRRKQVDKLYQQAATIREQAARRHADITEKRAKLARALRRRRARMRDAQTRRDRLAKDELRRRQAQLDADALRREQELNSGRKELAAEREAFAETQMRIEIERAHIAEDAQRLEEARRRFDIEREGLDAALADLEQQRLQLERSRADLENQLEAAQSVLDLAQLGIRFGGRAIRAAVLAGVCASAAALGWWRIEQPSFLATLCGVIHDERPAAEHVEMMLSDSFAEHLGASEDARLWRDAVRTGDAGVSKSPGSNELRLRLRLGDPDRARRVLPSVWRAYESYVLANPLDVRRTTRWRDWRRRMDDLTSRLNEIRAEIEETQRRRDAMPEHRSWDQAITALDAAQSELAEIRLKAADQQRLVEQLARAAPQPTEVLESQVLAALADDPVYNEDFKEYAAYARQYQQELATVADGVRAELATLRDALERMARAADELATPQVSTTTRASLEEVRAAVGAFVQTVAAMENAWRQKLDAVRNIDPVDRLVDLVEAQNTAQDAAARAERIVRDGLSGIAETIRALAGAADLRAAERVAISELQDALHGASRAQAKAVAMFALIDPLRNVRLDAADRQLRSLRTRLRQRSSAARQTLERRAAEQAERKHAETLRSAEQRLRELTTRRDDLLSEVVKQSAQLRRIELSSHAFVEIDAHLRVLESAREELEQQAAVLRGREPLAAEPTVAVGDAEVRQLSGEQRAAHAASLGGAVFAGVWGLSMLLFTRRSRRPRLSRASHTEPRRCEAGESA